MVLTDPAGPPPVLLDLVDRLPTDITSLIPVGGEAALPSTGVQQIADRLRSDGEPPAGG